MTESIESLKRRIIALEIEIERLKTRPALSLTGTRAVIAGGKSLTVMGSEEMILQVMPDSHVGYVNSPMAKLLGMPDRKAPLGSHLSQWDVGPLGKGVLTALCHVARSENEPQTLEHPIPNVPDELLPSIDLPESVDHRILRFTAVEQKERVHIVALDVTRIRWIEHTFSRYVSPAVIERMHGLNASEFLRTERRELTILFGDLRGFTSMCQDLTPEQVQETVNSFLANMVSVIESVDGTIDKFVGDEVMVIFGAPVPQGDHALRALTCAVEMQKAHGQWQKERAELKLPHRPMGIGLATGQLVVGNIGTESRMDYTVLGHTVNLAARLCGSAKGGEILTVPHTHKVALSQFANHTLGNYIPRFAFANKGDLTFKNVKDTVPVLTVATKV
jgi:class 3 adenylate cyclase